MQPISATFITRVVNNLAQYNLTLEQVSKWRYYGGSDGSHLNYYRLCEGKSVEPLDPQWECGMCGQDISENCYITDGSQILIVGNDCIRRFVNDSTRTRTACGKPNTNRADNYCTACRKERKGNAAQARKAQAYYNKLGELSFPRGKFKDLVRNSGFVNWFEKNKKLELPKHRKFQIYMQVAEEGGDVAECIYGSYKCEHCDEIDIGWEVGDGNGAQTWHGCP